VRKGGRCFIFPISVVLTAFIAVSCSEPQKPQERKDGDNISASSQITVRFENSWGGNDSKADTLQTVLDKFMKDNPGVEVKNESMFGDDFLPKIKTDFASGNNPDVFGLWPGSDIRALVKTGKVADLTDILAEDREWKNSFGKDMWGYTTFDGRIYGLPVEIIFECLFINRDLFDKYGVKLPETYEDLKEAVKAFREHNIIPIAYNSLAEGTYIYQNFIAALGGKQAVEHPFEDGGIAGCYVDAMNYVKELYHMGAFPKEAFTLTSNARNNLFKSKQAAMIVQGSWFLGENEIKNTDSNVDIIRFPSVMGGRSDQSAMIYGLGCGVFYMSRTAADDPEKKAVCIKLLKALTSRETAALFAEQTGMLSNVEIDSSKVNYGRLTKKGREMLDTSKELIGPPDSFVDRSVWEDIIVKQFPYVLEEEKSARDLWNEAIKAGAAEN